MCPNKSWKFVSKELSEDILQHEEKQTGENGQLYITMLRKRSVNLDKSNNF